MYHDVVTLARKMNKPIEPMGIKLQMSSIFSKESNFGFIHYDILVKMINLAESRNSFVSFFLTSEVIYEIFCPAVIFVRVACLSIEEKDADRG